MLKAWSTHALLGTSRALGMWDLMEEYQAIWGCASEEVIKIPVPPLSPPLLSSLSSPPLWCIQKATGLNNHEWKRLTL